MRFALQSYFPTHEPVLSMANTFDTKPGGLNSTRLVSSVMFQLCVTQLAELRFGDTTLTNSQERGLEMLSSLLS